MISDWIGHYHRQWNSPVARLPAAFKMAVAFALILGTVLTPIRFGWWYVAVFAILAVTIVASRIPVLFLAKRLFILSPLVLGVALVNMLEPARRGDWSVIALKSMLCLVTVILVSNTTPFSRILRVLQRLRVPALLVTTIALMHRYLFVLIEETERMRRARASRTFTTRKPALWHSLSTVLAQLFVRASERAERIYDAMCARGWR
jgi:cobalt/nickel transport system permease protein